MTAPLIYDLAPARLASTVLAIDNLRRTPNILSERFQHSGNEYGSVMRVSGAAPRARFETPFWDAFNLIGFKGLEVTTADLYLAKFVSGLRSTTTARKLSLTASCKAFAYIRSARVGPHGVLMAEVELVYTSNTGMAFPVTPSDGNTIPTLGAEPTLHTIGPSSIAGVAYAGVESFDLDLGQNVVDGIDGLPGDGLLYPTVCQLLGGEPVMNVAHGDPTTLDTVLSQVGAAIGGTAFIQYFRQYDTTTHLALATGLSFTAASGRIDPVDQNAPGQRVAKGGFRVMPLSATTAHPIAVASGQAVPTP